MTCQIAPTRFAGVFSHPRGVYETCNCSGHVLVHSLRRLLRPRDSAARGCSLAARRWISDFRRRRRRRAATVSLNSSTRTSPRLATARTGDVDGHSARSCCSAQYRRFTFSYRYFINAREPTHFCTSIPMVSRRARSRFISMARASTLMASSSEPDFTFSDHEHRWRSNHRSRGACSGRRKCSRRRNTDDARRQSASRARISSRVLRGEG